MSALSIWGPCIVSGGGDCTLRLWDVGDSSRISVVQEALEATGGARQAQSERTGGESGTGRGTHDAGHSSLSRGTTTEEQEESARQLRHAKVAPKALPPDLQSARPPAVTKCLRVITFKSEVSGAPCPPRLYT